MITLLRFLGTSYDSMSLGCPGMFKNSSDLDVVFKAAATDMRHFARSKFSGSLVHKNKFGLT